MEYRKKTELNASKAENFQEVSCAIVISGNGRIQNICFRQSKEKAE